MSEKDNSDTVDEAGTLKVGEFHPAASSALAYVQNLMTDNPIKWMRTLEAIASTALSGNRQAEICYATIQRVSSGQPVSDRYILGLAWMLRQLEGK